MRAMDLADADRTTLLAIIAAQTEEVTALRAQVVALTAHVAELTARLGQNSTNSSRPPSSDPPTGRPRPPTKAPSGRRAGAERAASPAIAAIIGSWCPPTRWTAW
jgi:transposase